MSTSTARRFWTKAEPVPATGGHEVHLDGRPVRTPAKAPLVVPTRALAEAVAREWNAQEDKVEPATMPMTRSANAAIDKVATQHAEVAEMVADFGRTDLLCYRATAPKELIDRQDKVWTPYLDWAREALGAPLVTVAGVMPVAQPEASLQALRARVHAMSAFELTAFHDLVGLSGSLILGFAATQELRPVGTIWDASRVDHLWQEEQWGQDADAARDAALKRAAFFHAKAFHDLARATD
ncbi:ATP12 family chaperone protein [Sediminimonas sp.]|uniref:ATP12 family chaperone protein n=1 Tax=Sediminimonas sp. TaxID=2823379 RepID=UPI0025F65EA4|nr:ATP12 family protein [Sediminimonas sp.]